MLGWYLTRVDLRRPVSSNIAVVMTSGEAGTSNAASVAFPGYIGCGSGVITGRQFQQLVGILALQIILLGAWHFLLAPFLVVRPLLPLIFHPLLGFLHIQ